MKEASKRIENLSHAQLDLLMKRLKQAKARKVQPEGITKCRRKGPLPLSFAQERLWFLEQVNPGDNIFNIGGAVRFEGALNLTALAHSLSEIARRHEILRTKFVSVDGKPAQVILPIEVGIFPIIDLSGLIESEREKQLQQLCGLEIRRKFDFANGPSMRTSVINLSSHIQSVVQTTHHIICDGWSKPLYYQEVWTLYQAFSEGKPSPLSELPIQYADFAFWQRNLLKGKVLESQLDYWKKQLKNAPPVLKLLAARQSFQTQTSSNAMYASVLVQNLTDDLKRFGQKEKVSLFMILLTAFKVLIYRYSGQEDLVVGTAASSRNRYETESLIGCFINLLALRTNLSGNPSLLELVHRVREVALGAYAHQDVPFEKLVDELRLPRELHYKPVVQALLVLQNTPSSEVELPGLKMKKVNPTAETKHYDLLLTVKESTRGLALTFQYNAAFFNAVMIEQMLDHLTTILREICANPEKRLLDISLPVKVNTREVRGNSALQRKFKADQFEI